MNTKHILCALLVGSYLTACQKEQPSSSTNLVEGGERTIRFESTLDPTYEFDDNLDDNALRAAHFEGIEVPRIVLDGSDFSGSPSSSDRNTTSLRLNLMAIDAGNVVQNKVRYKNTNTWIKGFSLYVFNGQNASSLYTSPASVQVKPLEQGYNIAFDFKWKDHAAIAPIAGTAWFGQLHIGGATGYELDNPNGSIGYFKHYFSHEIPRISDANRKRTEPNDEIREVLPDQPIQRRHFPMIGELIPLKLFTNKEIPSNQGAYNGQGHNQGVLGDRNEPTHKVVIRPRGTVIVLKLSNETGRNIDVVNLQSPLGKGFDFEVYYDTNLCRPFPTSTDGTGLEQKNIEELRQMIDPNGLIAPAVGYNSYSSDRAQSQFRIFALRSNRPENANPLEVGQKSPGVFMLWVNANEPNNALRLRVTYKDEATGTLHTSLSQEVTPPQGSFAEGKAYRVTLPIKIDPTDAPRP